MVGRGCGGDEVLVWWVGSVVGVRCWCGGEAVVEMGCP